MTIDRWHPRRTEGGRRSSKVRGAGFRSYPRVMPRQDDQHGTVDPTELLVAGLMDAARGGSVRADATFGDYASLFAFLRSCVMQEGRLLELAIAEAAQANPDLRLLPPKAMPIVPSAQEMLKRTPGHAIKGIRFPSRVHSSETYTPDLFIVDQVKHTGLILDIKRSLGSYRPQEVERLRFRMLAVASIASEWIVERQGPVLVEVETAIVDGADEVSDHESGVFRLSEIDHLLGTDGAAESITRTRAMFADRVQAELRRRCRDLFQDEDAGPALKVVAESDLAAATRIADDVEPHPWSGSAGAARFGYARRPGLH